MVKRIGIISGLFVALSASSYAAPCVSGGNLTALLLSVSCTQSYTGSGGSYDITFGNFATTLAGGIQVDTVYSNAIGLGGFTFKVDQGTLPALAGDFTYSAQISNCSVGYTCLLTGVKDQMNGGITPGAQVSVSQPPGASSNPALLQVGSETYVSGITNSVGPLSKTLTYNGVATLITLETEYFSSITQDQVIPEPATLTMLGSALVGLGLFFRRKK